MATKSVILQPVNKKIQKVHLCTNFKIICQLVEKTAGRVKSGTQTWHHKPIFPYKTKNSNLKINFKSATKSINFLSTTDLTSPRTLKSELLPQPLGPQTNTLTPERTSKVSSFTKTSPLGVTSGTLSKWIMLSWKMILPAPGIRGIGSWFLLSENNK